MDGGCWNAFSYSVEYMEASKKSSRTSSKGRRKGAAVVPNRTDEHIRRSERTIHFLTQDELRRLFKVMKSKRDRAIFLVAYRHGLRASEIGLLQREHSVILAFPVAAVDSA